MTALAWLYAIWLYADLFRTVRRWVQRDPWWRRRVASEKEIIEYTLSYRHRPRVMHRLPSRTHHISAESDAEAWTAFHESAVEHYHGEVMTEHRGSRKHG